jgi:hypothetical protein
MVISCFILVNKAHIGVLRSQTFCKRCRFLVLLKTYTDSEKYISWKRKWSCWKYYLVWFIRASRIGLMILLQRITRNYWNAQNEPETWLVFVPVSFVMFGAFLSWVGLYIWNVRFGLSIYLLCNLEVQNIAEYMPKFSKTATTSYLLLMLIEHKFWYCQRAQIFFWFVPWQLPAGT